MKIVPLIVILFFMIPPFTQAQVLFNGINSVPPISRGPMKLQFPGMLQQISQINAIVRPEAAIPSMSPFSGAESKTPKKAWKWIGFGTLQAAAWAAVFHCGAPKLSVPVLLAVSYVFLF
jgi:hypothetical protein